MPREFLDRLTAARVERNMLALPEATHLIMHPETLLTFRAEMHREEMSPELFSEKPRAYGLWLVGDRHTRIGDLVLMDDAEYAIFERQAAARTVRSMPDYRP